MMEFFVWIFRIFVLTVAAVGWLGVVWRWPWEAVEVEPVLRYRELPPDS